MVQVSITFFLEITNNLSPSVTLKQETPVFFWEQTILPSILPSKYEQF